MKKNFKVIQLNGASGIILFLLIVGAILGSILILPVYGVKFIWNYFMNGYFDIQTIRLSQASLLWCAILAIIYGYLKNKIQFRFVNSANIVDNHFRNINYDDIVRKLEKEENEEKNDEKVNH